MRMPVHPFVRGASVARWSRPWCGPCSPRPRHARAGCASPRAPTGRERGRGAGAIAIGGESHGRAIVGGDARAKRAAAPPCPPQARSSQSCPLWRLWAGISWRLGASHKGPWPRWWPSATRRSRPISVRSPTTPLPWGITGRRRGGGAGKRCLVRPGVASSAFPRAIPARIRSRRYGATGITAPRCVRCWGHARAEMPRQRCCRP